MSERIPGSMCRVLHVITDLRVGGAEIQLARLVEKEEDSLKSPVELVGVACLGGGGEIGTRLAASGVRVWAFGARTALGFLAGARKLGRLVRDERVDVVVAWLYHPMIASSLPGVLPQECRLVWNVRGTLPTARDKRSTRFAVEAARVLSERPQRIVYNSERARREHEASGYSAGASMVIPNGFEVPSARPWRPPRPEPRVISIARYHPMKDFPNFLRAIARLRARGFPVAAELVGEGCDDRNTMLLSQIDALGIRDCVTLTGAVSSIDDALSRADVVVSSSSWGEGFQNVLAEAALAGVAIVSTDVGEARLIVGDDRFIAPPNDAEGLAGAIARVLELPVDVAPVIVTERRERLAAAFGVSAMRHAYARLYASVHAPRF